MATSFGTTIAMNAYLRQTTGTLLLITGVFVVVQSEEDISDSKVLRRVATATHVATATKFWPK